MNLTNTKIIIRDYFARNRVSFGLLMGTGVLIFMRPCERSLMVAGIGISFVGLAIRSWAAGCIKKSKTLCMEGPYSFVRHPLYLGSFLMSAGIGIAFTCFDSPWASGLFWSSYALYYWSFYTAAISNEEKLLSERFAAEWPSYRERVPAFIPFRLIQIVRARFNSFSWAQYNKNKEYNAVIGWAATVALILFVYPPSIMQMAISNDAVVESIHPEIKTVPYAKINLSIPKASEQPAQLAADVEQQLVSVPIETITVDTALNEELPAGKTELALVKKEEDSLEELDSPQKLNLINPWLGTAVLGTTALGMFDGKIRSNIQNLVAEPIGHSLKDAGGSDRPLERMGDLTTGLGVSAGFYTVGSLSKSTRAKRVGVVGVQALLVNSLLSETLMHSVGRKAPSESDPDDFQPMHDNESFPSPKTSSAFTLASVVAEEYDSIWVDSVSYGLASAVGFSRLSEDQNWASDVAAGALLGIVVGKFTYRFDRKKGWSKRLYMSGNSVTYKQKF